MLMMGVEEEFLLLAEDGSVSPVASRVVRLAGQAGIRPAFMAYQVRTATAVCTRLDELRRDLVRSRLIAADSAERCGARLVAAGALPLSMDPPFAPGENPRYRELARRFPAAAAGGATCACHVHIGISDRDLAVAVLARLRPWLPALLALTVNSPFAGARDTGWASFRYHRQLRWPTFRLPGTWSDAERYDQVVRALVASGAAMDTAAVHMLARLSPRVPTIQVRVADTCLDVEDTVLYAGVVRALVASLIDDVQRREKVLPVPTALVEAQLLTAAHGQMRIRRGRTAGPADALSAEAVARLLARVAPYLAASHGGEDVFAGIERLRREGTGAERQRRMWSGRPAAFVHSLAEATIPIATAHELKTSTREPKTRVHNGVPEAKAH
jgi:carboxylate-amine ligase